MRADATSDGVFVVAVPTARVPTLYARTGEVVPLAALAFCFLVMVRIIRSRPPPASRHDSRAMLMPITV